MMIKSMWDYALEEKYTDVIIIEKLEYPPENHSPRTYPAHRLVLSTNCDYFKTQFESNFNDSITPTVNVFGNHQYPGLLGVILEAIYSDTKLAEEIYNDFVIENCLNLDKCIAIYNVCGFLLLHKHMEYIEISIRNIFTTSELIQWWNNHPIADTYVPMFITSYLRKLSLNIFEVIPDEMVEALLIILENDSSRKLLTDTIKEKSGLI